MILLSTSPIWNLICTSMNISRLFSVNCSIPVRLNLGIMMFMACFSSYMLRVNISINILAMTRPTPVTTGRTSTVMMATNIYLNETLMRKIAENFVSPSTTYAVPNVSVLLLKLLLTYFMLYKHWRWRWSKIKTTDMLPRFFQLHNNRNNNKFFLSAFLHY